nr:MAG TPA: hypothetical protein [Caudoviricetes sp.]
MCPCSTLPYTLKIAPSSFIFELLINYFLFLVIIICSTNNNNVIFC